MRERLDRPAAEALVKSMAGLVKAQALYPGGHSAVQKAEQALEAALQGALARQAPLLLGRTDGYLVAGGVAFLGGPPQASDLCRLLERRQIEGVILEPEVRGSEVGQFLQWLRAEGDQPWSGDALSLTQLSRGGATWQRGARVHRLAVEALGGAYRELAEGRIPDPRAARDCVQSFSEILAEKPGLLQGLVLIKDYDRYTFHHSVNVCLLTLILARQMGIGADETECLGISGLFHDIGKTRTPPEVIRKPGRLTSAEWSLMWRHPEHGRDILSEMGGIPEPAPRIVFEHHMRHDGGGYPSRDPGYALSTLSPVVTIADVYDAMTTHRSYSAPLPLPEAVIAMERLRGTHFPPHALGAFLDAVGRVPVGSMVRLSSGEVAVVTRLGPRGEVDRARIVISAQGTRFRPEDALPRDVRPSDVVHWVNPLNHGIDPAEVVRADL